MSAITSHPAYRPITDETDQADQLTRIQIDRSCRTPVTWYFVSAVFWLLVGSLLAMLASLKLGTPGFLGQAEWLTFGRVRPAHLNAVGYGFMSQAAAGTLVWLTARLCKTRVPWPSLLAITCVVWNVAMVWGLTNILMGNGTSIEWLEMPLLSLAFFGFIFVCLGASIITMFVQRQEKHTYVSQWYMFAAVIWFPILYIVATAMNHWEGVNGVAKAMANWWFGHNALGLFWTPTGIAATYYLIPKVIGRPIHSYHLSLLGFWSLALFYNWAGTHHLIGGPLPAWLITVGIIGSMMMFIPVIALGFNHHLTMWGHFHQLKTSPTLRFVVFGAMAYTVTSFQGSLESLRDINVVTHFTHYTVGHAHLGAYGFFAMVMFGTMYYVMPRLTRNEWSSPTLIKWHFWLCGLGILLYFFDLCWAGWYQGKMMNDANVPFLNIVQYTKPFLHVRSLAGTMMTVGHVIFGWLMWRILHTSDVVYTGPALFGSKRAKILGGAA